MANGETNLEMKLEFEKLGSYISVSSAGQASLEFRGLKDQQRKLILESMLDCTRLVKKVVLC